MVEVIIGLTRYSESDRLLINCLRFLTKQKNVEFEVIILDQKKSNLVKDFCKNNNNQKILFKYKNIKQNSISKVRNKLINLSKSNYLIFIEPDVECFDPFFIEKYIKSFKKTKAVVIGGKLIPKWEKRPLLITKSKYIREFYSLLDLGDKEFKINKLIGANFGINLKLIQKFNLTFDNNLGRNKNLIGGEETKFMLDVGDKGLLLIYNGKLEVRHIVSKNRISYLWIFKRSFYGGLSRVLTRKYKIKPFNKKFEFIDYICLIIISPFYILGYLYGLILILLNSNK